MLPYPDGTKCILLPPIPDNVTKLQAGDVVTVIRQAEGEILDLISILFMLENKAPYIYEIDEPCESCGQHPTVVHHDSLRPLPPDDKTSWEEIQKTTGYSPNKENYNA